MKSRQSFLSSAAYFCNLTNPRDKKNIWKLSKCRVKTRCVLKNSFLSHSNVNFPGHWNHETHRPLPSLALSLTLQTNNVQQQKLKSKWQKKLSSRNPAGREETEIVWWLYAVVILSLSLSLFSSCFFFLFLLTKQSKSVKMKHVRSGSKEAAAEEMWINVMWSDVREASSTFKLLLHIT